MKRFHLIAHEGPGPGDYNMAVDEYLFRSLAREPGTIVRFYGWERPTASLGFGQAVDRVVDLAFCRSQGIDVVRRITGGKLVLHHQEVTYTVASSDGETFSGTLGGSYKLISRSLVRGLEALGLRPTLADEAPPFYAKGTMPCFAHPARDEIEIDGRKIVGSAQKRMGGMFVQHGSVPLAHDERLLKSVSLRRDDPGRIGMTSLSEVLGRPVGFGEAAAALADGLAAFFEADLVPYSWTDRALEEVERLRRNKHASEDWVLRGRDPEA